MSRVKVKHIFLFIVLIILLLADQAYSVYRISDDLSQVNQLPPKSLATAVWVGVIYSILGALTPLVLNKAVVKMNANPSVSQFKLLSFVFICILLPALVFSIAGQILVMFGMPYWKFLCFAAAGLLATLIWALWQIKKIRSAV
jgi:hypothetical protein